MHLFCFILLKKLIFWSGSEQMWTTSSTQSIFYKNWNFEELFSSLLANLMNEPPWRCSYPKTTIKNKVDKGLNDYRKSQLTIKTKTKNTCYYFIVLSLRIKMKNSNFKTQKFKENNSFLFKRRVRVTQGWNLIEERGYFLPFAQGNTFLSLSFRSLHPPVLKYDCALNTKSTFLDKFQIPHFENERWAIFLEFHLKRFAIL